MDCTTGGKKQPRLALPPLIVLVKQFQIIRFPLFPGPPETQKADLPFGALTAAAAAALLRNAVMSTNVIG